ncbi:hypothetical protein MTP99_013175, partial [Tenebrio molitor]
LGDSSCRLDDIPAFLKKYF